MKTNSIVIKKTPVTFYVAGSFHIKAIFYQTNVVKIDFLIDIRSTGGLQLAMILASVFGVHVRG